MADEAVLVYELEPPIPFTVTDANGIEKGAICSLEDPITASGTTADGSLVAGIAASEKIASDGKTKLGIYRKGIFKVTLSGTCTAGDILETDVSPNHVAQYDAAVSGTRMIGTALESGNSGTILMELNIGPGGNA